MVRFSLIAIGLFLSGDCIASGGTLDAKGCHVDPVSKQYHCHDASQALKDAAIDTTVDHSVSDPSGDDRLYRDCAHLRSLQVPLPRKGERGYAARLDADHNGVACD